MAIIVPKTFQDRFLNLIETLRSSEAVPSLDWEAIKIRMEIDEVTVADWVAIMRRVQTLLPSTQLRSQAEDLMHAVKWYVPIASDESNAETPDPTPLGRDLELLRHFFKELSIIGFTSNTRLMEKLGELETGTEAVRAFLDSGWMARRQNLFKPVVKRIYDLVLAKGGIGDEERWDEARGIIGSIYADIRGRQATIEDKEVFRTVLPYLQFILGNHPDPFARYFAVELIARGASRMPFSAMTNEFMTELFGRALHDSEPLIATTAWKSAYTMNASFATELPPDAFSPQPVIGALSNGVKWQLYFDHWGPLRYQLAEDMLSMRLRDENPKTTATTTEFSIGDFLPYHPLRDFDSSNDIRQPVMKAKLELLERLVDEFGLEDRETIMRFFLKEPPTENSGERTVAEAAWALELRSGKRILKQGHHRIAAIIVAVMKGVIPEDWLLRIPLTVYHYDGPVPDALMERVFGRGHWEDIFPPEMRADLPQIVRRRSGGTPRGGAPQGPLFTPGTGIVPGGMMAMGAMNMMPPPANMNMMRLR